MSVKKIKTAWVADISPARGFRVRKRFKTKAEALHFERVTLQRFLAGEAAHTEKDKRTLKELIELHFNLHGQFLKTGKERKSKLLYLANIAGNPPAYKLSPAWFVSLRALRAKTVKPNTLNHDRAYLLALFNDLINLGFWQAANPISKTKPLDFPVSPMAYLSKEEIKRLLDACLLSENKHLYLIVRICLETGARWSEAEKLQVSHFKNGILSYWNTKSNKARHIPIAPELAGLLKKHKKHSINRFFSNSYSDFSKALKAASLNLPAGQNTHVLRHTFASHFVMNGGSILELQKVLGHSSLAMTMRYAHLEKNHLGAAVKFNPLKTI